ncbi:MAG TPA: 3-deoxy-D-manno-octulosonic acid transferase, partial [Gammaproteobacteria bacterium]|nr:3-deoxy-D-manno-octulosonic acid transferase [Gammaproteobacteria bacterium]
ELVRNAGGQEVRDAAQLRAILARLHREPGLAASMGDAARRVVVAGQGATQRNVGLVIAQLERGSH